MRRSWALILFAAMMSAPLAASPACAQDADEPEEAAAPAPPARQRVRISARQFDRLLFGNEGDSESARRIIEARLKSRIGFVDQLCGITRDQRKKLELAGRGDIKRFFDRVEKLREQILDAADIDRLRGLIVEAQELGKVFRQQLFADESIFAKTLRVTLDREQSARCYKLWDENRLLRHQSRVEWVALTLQKNLVLSDGERLRFLVVLLEETRPPRGFGPSDYHGIMYQASQIPESKLRPVFDRESSWRSLRAEFDDALRREPMLRESGYLPEDRPAWDSVRGGPPRGVGVDKGPASPALGRGEARDGPPPARGKRAT
jgi:hypothetical protein